MNATKARNMHFIRKKGLGISLALADAPHTIPEIDPQFDLDHADIVACPQ